MDEVKSIFKELFDLSGLFSLEKLRAGSDEGFHHPDAVLSCPASGFGNLFFRLRPVGAVGFHQMKIQPAPAGIHIRVTGVGFLGALVMGFNAPDFRPLVLCKAQDGILGFFRQVSLRFCQTMS